MRARSCFILTALLFCAFLRGFPQSQRPGAMRTVRLKIVVDEELRRRPAWSVEVRRWVNSCSPFFEENFGLRLQIQHLGLWSSDNIKYCLADLFADLSTKVERGDCDIVVGVTAQISGMSEPNGLASYLRGYAIIRRLPRSGLNKRAFIHELCHLFGAVDLEEKISIMNKTNNYLHCDRFTRRIVVAHKDRRFDGTSSWLDPEAREFAISLYEQRKELGRREVGICIMLAVLCLEKGDYERALRECLEAERMEPGLPGLQGLLRTASDRKK